MATQRISILNGVKAAKQLHERLGSRAALERGIGRVDVFKSLVNEGASLLFRPLDGALGLYIDEPAEGVYSPGVLISTKRELHVQRFTAAHELGHFVLRHNTSVDTDLGPWRSDLTANYQELEADAFAGEFLAPLWLIQHHAERHGWTPKRLQDPHVVYQLSLRLCASYEATCWGLVGHALISPKTRKELLGHSPKSLKQAALNGTASLDNSWANVWVFDEKDKGLEVEGGPDDIFVFRLKEHAASGYLWNESRFAASGLELLDDRRVSGAEMGDTSQRVLVTRARGPVTLDLEVTEQRPWLPKAPALETVTLTMDLQGKEIGLPRVQRRALAA